MKYRKKPVVVEAIQYTNGKADDVLEFARGHSFINWYGIFIRTLEGDMKVLDKDYIIKGVNGEFYPCKPDIFDKTYELVQ